MAGAAHPSGGKLGVCRLAHHDSFKVSNLSKDKEKCTGLLYSEGAWESEMYMGEDWGKWAEFWKQSGTKSILAFITCFGYLPFLRGLFARLIGNHAVFF